MADQIMSGATELGALRPELWSAAFYPTLLEALPFNSLVATDYQGEISGVGNTVNITTFPQFASADTISETGRVDAEALTPVKTQLVIDQLVVKDFVITDMAMVQTIDSVNVLRDLAFHAIMKRIQQIIIAAIVPSASSPDHTLAFGSGTTLALADILAAKELKDNADVPDSERAMVLGPAQWNDIFNITGFTSRDFVTANPLQDGSLPGQVLGYLPKMTSEVGNVAYLFHKIFMQMAVQKNLEVKVFDLGVEGKRAFRVNSSLLMGVKQLSNLRVVTIG